LHTPQKTRRCGSFSCTGGTLNANGGTVDFYSNWTTHNCFIRNAVFQNITFGGAHSGSALNFETGATNTVLGDIRHTGGRVDKATWLLHGDLYVTNAAYAGSSVARFISEEPQEIRFAPGAKAFGIAMDKPEDSTLTVVGGSCIFGGGNSAANTFGDLALLSGVFDASGVTNFMVSTYNDIWTNASAAVFKAPDLVDIRGYQCKLHANGLVFSNLSFGVTDGRLLLQAKTTNTVAGDLKILYSGLADGTLAVKGDIYCLKTITGGYHAGGNGVVLANGDRDQTLYAATNGAMPTLVIDKPAGTALRTEGNILTFVAPGAGVAGGHLTLASGHFTLPASNLVFESYGSQFVQKPGTTLDAGESTVFFNSWSPKLAFTDAELHRVVINTPISSGLPGNNLNIEAGTTATVARALVQTRGLLNASAKGVLRLLGDLEIGERASGGSAPLVFAGGNDQLYNNQGTNVTLPELPHPARHDAASEVTAACAGCIRSGVS